MIGRIGKALRPKGRFVAEMGGHGCVKTVHQVLIDELNRRGHDAWGQVPGTFRQSRWRVREGQFSPHAT